MTSTAAAMPSSGMDMGREKSLRNGSGALVAGGAASLPSSFLIGLFRIWKGDSASLHAARATRHREHLRVGVVRFGGLFPRGVVLARRRRGAAAPRAGARGDPAVQAGRRLRRAAAPRRQTPLQRRRRQAASRAAPLVLREAAFSGLVATASRVGPRLSYSQSHLIVCSLGNKCLLRARAQRPRLNNPTRLLFDFGRFFPAYSV